MGFLQNLSTLALRQLAPAAAEAAGDVVGAAAEATVAFLTRHFTDHSQALDAALRLAADRAWKALEVALAGESLWSRLASAEDRALRQQLRAFLDAADRAGLTGGDPDFRRRCLDELRAARGQGLLTGGDADPDDLAQRVGELARFDNPRRLLDAEWQAVAGMAEYLAGHGHAHLARLLGLRPPQGPPLLALAVRYFFRRAVEEDGRLFRGLAWASWERLAQDQEEGFAGLDRALAEHGRELELRLSELRVYVVQTHGAVLDIKEELAGQCEQIRALGRDVVRMLERQQLEHRPLRPHDSLSLRTEDERRLVKQLVGHYRALPEEERRRLPALLNGLGKLEVVAGDFEAARRDFQQAAALAGDGRLRAEAHYHAYQAALQQRDWTAALSELREAIRLDGPRLAPFPLDKYAPQRILGAGGFGVVFLCRHAYMRGEVVVKALAGEELVQGVDRVFAEAAALRLLEHESVIRVHDCGYADPAGRGRPYLVMDYFEGGTLEEAARAGPLALPDAVQVARQMAEGLRAAHARGVLHRDVKPANVLGRQTQTVGGPCWQVKLIDFGLALEAAALQTTKVSSKTLLGHTIAGTLDYAAPEQLGKLSGVPVGPRADIYGFGRTLCYVLFQTPQPLRKHWNSLPPALADLLEACLAQRPDDRPADFDEVLRRLPGPDGGESEGERLAIPPAIRDEAELKEVVGRLLREGDRIGAMRKYREATGLGLTDARGYAAQLEREFAEETERQRQIEEIESQRREKEHLERLAEERRREEEVHEEWERRQREQAARQRRAEEELRRNEPVEVMPVRESQVTQQALAEPPLNVTVERRLTDEEVAALRHAFRFRRVLAFMGCATVMGLCFAGLGGLFLFIAHAGNFLPGVFLGAGILGLAMAGVLLLVVLFHPFVWVHRRLRVGPDLRERRVLRLRGLVTREKIKQKRNDTIESFTYFWTIGGMRFQVYTESLWTMCSDGREATIEWLPRSGRLHSVTVAGKTQRCLEWSDVPLTELK